MRKLPLLLVLSAISFNSFAQEEIAKNHRFPTQEHHVLVGTNSLLQVDPGGGGGNSASTDYQGGFDVRAGYFVNNNVALGINVRVNRDNNGTYAGKTRHIKFGAFGRCYIGSGINKKGTVRKLRFFVEAGTGYEKIHYISDDYLTSYSIMDVRLMPGVNYFVKPWVAFEFGANGLLQLGDWRRTEGFFGPNLGLQFFLDRR